MPKAKIVHMPGTSAARRNSKRRILVELLESRRMLAAGNGLLGQYYNNSDFSGTPLTRLDAVVDFDWGSSSPLLGTVDDDNFTVRWSGEVEARFTQPHQFIVSADDGARLWVNGLLMFDQLDAGSIANEMHEVELIAGRRYAIQLEYRERSGPASVKLEWSAPSLPREVIPVIQLFASQRGGIQQQQWLGVPGDSLVDLESWPTFPHAPDSSTRLGQFETSSNVGDQLGRRLRGYVHPPVSGPYQFLIAADEVAELRLSLTNSVDDAGTIASVTSPTAPRQWDAQSEQTSSVFYLQAGQSYYIEAIAKEAVGEDHLAVAWLRPDRLLPEVIPGDLLSPVVPLVQLYAIQPRISEASTAAAQFQVVRSGDSAVAPLDVYYSLGGTATAGDDFQSLSGILTIPAGQSSADLWITPLVDEEQEGDEQVTIELLSQAGYVVGYRSERTAIATLQDDHAPPAGGTSLFDGQSLGNFIYYGGNFTTQNDAHFGQVIQAVIPAGQPEPWSSGLLQGVDAPVVEGDLLLVDFYMRALNGAGVFTVNFELAGAPHTKSLAQGVTASPDWQRIQLPFTAVESYAVGAANLTLHLGGSEQTLQFANFQLLNYGPPRSLAPESGFGLNQIEGSYGVAQTVPVTGQPFDFAYQVQTLSVPAQFWHFQAVERNDAIVRTGDTLRLEFSIRATAGLEPLANFGLQRTDTWATLASQMIPLSDDWQSIVVDVPVDADFDRDGLQVAFSLGYGLQTVEIGGFHWTNLAYALDLADLPVQFPAASYGGREGASEWRQGADGRIAAERMATVTVQVVDANQQPLAGATISLRQQQHAFLFGAAISAFGGKLDPEGNETALKYQSEIKRLFNAVSLENSLKWPSFLQDRQRAIEGVAFATNNDLYLRGHNMIWPSRTHMPNSVWTEYDSREDSDGVAAANAWLQETIEAHIQDLLVTFDGLIPEWDVVNEPFVNRDVMDLLGDEILLDWYQQVRDFDPTIRLTLNDYNILTRNGANATHRQNFESWLEQLRATTLLDMIGVQGHFNDATLTDMDILSQLIADYDDRFNTPIAVTEFDLDSSDQQLQADYLRDFVTMAFSQPAISKFVQWGFWNEAHWLPRAALYNSDFSIRPNGQVYEDLVFGRWWTDTTVTSRDGVTSLSAFLGDYDVSVQYQGQTYPASVTVDSSGNSQVTVTVGQQASNALPLLHVEQAAVSGFVGDPLLNSGLVRDPDLDGLTIVSSIGEVQWSSDGRWDWSYTPTERMLDHDVVITAVDSRGASTEIRFVVDALTIVRQRGVAYGGSTFGDLVAPDKTPLLRGETSGIANYTNYHLGLNRVMIDVAGLATTNLTDADFVFRVGNSLNLEKWTRLSATSDIPLPTITVHSTSTPGVQQIRLTWPDNAIRNQWLRVEFLPTANTGLATSDLFYFGNQIADVNGDVNLHSQVLVDARDAILVSVHQHPTHPAAINSAYDINRSGLIDAQDVSLARANRMWIGGLQMFTVPLDDSQEEPIKPPVAPPSRQMARKTTEFDKEHLRVLGSPFHYLSRPFGLPDHLSNEVATENRQSDIDQKSNRRQLTRLSFNDLNIHTRRSVNSAAPQSPPRSGNSSIIEPRASSGSVEAVDAVWSEFYFLRW